MSVTKAVYSQAAPAPGLKLPPSYLWHQAVIVRPQHPWVPAQAGGVAETPSSGLWRSLSLRRTLSGFTPGLCPGRPHFLGPICLGSRRPKGLGCRNYLILGGCEHCWVGSNSPLRMPRPHLVQSRLVVNVSEKSRVGAEDPLCVQETGSTFSDHGWWSWLGLSSPAYLRTQLAPQCL